MIKEDSKFSMCSLEDLNEQYQNVLICIEQTDSIKDLFDSKDLVYYIKRNELDYPLFLHCIKAKKEGIIAELTQIGFKYDQSTFLNEVFRNKKTTSTNLPQLDATHFQFMIECNSLIDFRLAKLEFFYLLLASQFNLAAQLLDSPKMTHLKQELIDIYLDLSHFSFASLTRNKEFARECLLLALKRSVEGIALFYINQ